MPGTGGWRGRGDAESTGQHPGPAPLHRSRSLQKIREVAGAESWAAGTGVGEETALPTHSRWLCTVWCV